jgi:hypothetical protein
MYPWKWFRRQVKDLATINGEIQELERETRATEDRLNTANDEEKEELKDQIRDRRNRLHYLEVRAAVEAIRQGERRSK